MKSLTRCFWVLSVGLVSTTAANASVVTDWNAITLACVQGPATPPLRGGPPGLLDIALVQAAVHDAIQAVQQKYEFYHYADVNMHSDGSYEAAGATAAYKMLVGLYGASAPCLMGVPNPEQTYAGDRTIQAGVAAAAALLPLKRPFFTLPIEPFTGGTAPGDWRLTPGITAATNMFMAFTPPFAILRPAQFRAAPPYSLSSQHYLRDYNEVKAKGAATGSTRTEAETELARFWSANFITQWFAVARALADAHVEDLGDQARLLALVAFVAADSQITVYDSKYTYNFWRPITAIQMGDDDGNPWTEGDPLWTSLIPNPPYPDWTSGANNITGAVTTILQLYFRTDSMEFSVSSTAAGVTVNPRKYERFSQAAREVVEARIFQGIHFRLADEEGRRQGTRIAVWTFNNVLRPLPPYSNPNNYRH